MVFDTEPLKEYDYMNPNAFTAAIVSTNQQYQSLLLSSHRIFLVTKSSLHTINFQPQIQFRYKEAPSIRFPLGTNVNNLGEELIEDLLTDPRKNPKRAKMRQEISKYLTDVYRKRMSFEHPGHEERIKRAAALMETDIFHQFKDVSRAEAALGSTLLAYVGRLDGTK